MWTSAEKLDYGEAFQLDPSQRLIADASCFLRSNFPSIRAPGRLYLFNDYVCFQTDAQAKKEEKVQTKPEVMTAKPGELVEIEDSGDTLAVRPRLERRDVDRVPRHMQDKRKEQRVKSAHILAVASSDDENDLSKTVRLDSCKGKNIF